MTAAPTISALAELRNYAQWVCFDGDKKPINPHTGYGADCNDAATWSSYDHAREVWRANKNKYKGLGFEFIKDQRRTCVDLDKCIDEQGEISEYAKKAVLLLNSYTEYSPSGRGLHIWVHGNIPKNLKIPGVIELYDHVRYITVTGRHLEGTPETIEERQDELSRLYQDTLAHRDRLNEQELKRKRQPPSHGLPPAGGDTPYGLAALSAECQGLASMHEGGRNDRLNIAAYSLGQLVAGNELTRSTVERELSAAAEQCGLPEREIEKTMRSGLESGMREPRSAPPVDDLIYGSPGGDGNNGNRQNRVNAGGHPDPNLQFILECLKTGEYGDSLLFAALFRGQVVYDHTEKEWYLWAGQYWEVDGVGKIKHLVSGKLASVYLRAGAELNLQVSQQEAKAEASGSDEEKAVAKERAASLKGLIKSLSERAFSLRQAARGKNVLYFASSELGMGITSKEWDTSPWLLAVPNGVVDLKTGICREGRPEDYIRTISPTTWMGLDAPAPRWDRFLQEIFEDRPEAERQELISFLQRFFGYGITGEVIEHVFGVLFGEGGRNGKDTIQRALSRTLGEVSCAIQKDVLLDAGRAKAAGSATPHLSDLQGKRLAWASEPEKGARFNIGQVKELSGGGDIPTRGLFEKKITKIKPSHLLLLLTNHKPHADASDSAFWDRLRLITFNMRFVDNPKEPNERKKDTRLWPALEGEASGILAWLVRGCLEWQRIGLATPDTVLRDGNQYREEEDDLITFLNECCVIAPGAEVKASRLYEAYKAWCLAGNLYTLNSTNFGLQLKKRKFEKKSTMKGVIYQGIGVLDLTNEGSMNSSSNPSYSSQAASEDTSKQCSQSDDEQYEQYKQKVSKNDLHESQNLGLSVQTIQTIHHENKQSTVNPPVVGSDDTMNSLRNPSSTVYEEEI